jgi:hypothetical protein
VRDKRAPVKPTKASLRFDVVTQWRLAEMRK